jgi:hypothetical protein
MESPEIGFGAALFFDKDQYDEIEIGEVQDMIARVVGAWYKRREFILTHPDEYNIAVN